MGVQHAKEAHRIAQLVVVLAGEPSSRMSWLCRDRPVPLLNQTILLGERTAIGRWRLSLFGQLAREVL
jgi:hypothetical protein